MVALAGLLGGGELAARRLWVDAPSLPRPELPPGDWPTIETLAQASQPNSAGVRRGVFYRTNANGDRGPDWPPRPAPGTLRVLLVGDSVALGSGVFEEERYTDLVPALLAADPRLPPVEVLNLSRGGTDTAQSRLRLAFGLRSYGGDITVYAFSLDDLHATPPPKVALTLRDQRDRAAALVAAEAPRSALWRTLLHVLGARTGPPWLYEHTSAVLANEPAWLAFRAQLAGIAKLNEGARTCGLVFIHPRLVELGPAHPDRAAYARVADEAIAAGLFVAEALPTFMWHHAPSLWVGHFDPHPNAAGHALLAEALADGLRALPKRCWGGA